MGERIAQNCANWENGVCQRCGVQWQYREVSADFKCPHWTPRDNRPPRNQEHEHE